MEKNLVLYSCAPRTHHCQVFYLIPSFHTTLPALMADIFMLFQYFRPFFPHTCQFNMDNFYSCINGDWDSFMLQVNKDQVWTPKLLMKTSENCEHMQRFVFIWIWRLPDQVAEYAEHCRMDCVEGAGKMVLPYPLYYSDFDSGRGMERMHSSWLLTRAQILVCFWP